MIEEIEELAEEAEPHLLAELKLTLKDNIGLRSSEAAEHIAPKIALLACGWRGKRSWIEGLATFGYCEP